MDLLERVMELCKTSPEPHRAIFDFDNTLIIHDCGEATIAYMARHGVADGPAQRIFKTYYSMLKAGDTRVAYRYAASSLKGLTVGEVERIVFRAMEEEGTTIGGTVLLGQEIAKGIAPREDVVRLMRNLQVRGIECWIVSASAELVVRAAMKYFQIRVKGVIGIRNVVKSGIVMPELQEPVPTFEGKVTCIKQDISATVPPLLAVGDSMNDYFMLKHALIRVVVNRNNPLTIEAEKLGWHILP